jgi:hypothetical protein
MCINIYIYGCPPFGCDLLPPSARAGALEPSAKSFRQKVTRQKVPAEGPMKMSTLFVVIWIIKFLQCIIFIIDLASSQATNCCPCDLPNMIADRGRSALKYRACAQSVSGATTVFSFWDAGLHQDEGSSALKHRACAQNVSDITHSFYIYGCCPTTR